MHDDELTVTDDQVRQLIAHELPALSTEPIGRLPATGSTNVLFRLGDSALVRLPRQPGGSQSIDTEARWLPVLGAELPVAVPELIAVGEPGFGYPERWSVTRWLDGGHPPVPADGNPALARDLAAFIGNLRGIAVPDEAAADLALHSYRAGSLGAIEHDIRDYLEQCRSLPGLRLDLDACETLWAEAVVLPDPSATPRWVHGDLLAENLLVCDGRLSAVLDFGALAVGDPCVDLMVAWEALTPADRETFRSALDVDDITWQRGRAWALAIALMTFPYYWNSLPARCANRLVMAQAALTERQ